MLCKVLCLNVLLAAITGALLKSESAMESFNQCLISTPVSFGYCLGIGALSKLQSIDSNPEFDVIDGLTFEKDTQQVREAYNFVDKDPRDLRTIVDSVGEIFTQRSLRWDMSTLYPGLTMRVAPSANPGGILEFVLDPNREGLAHQSLKESSTGKIIARQFLLPFLLGFKFNVATLIPIIFGALAIMAKKFFFICKLGLILSSAIGLASILFAAKPQHLTTQNQGYGGHYGHYGYNRLPDEQYYGETAYKENEGFGENAIRFFNGAQPQYSREDANNLRGRNFAWNEAEKSKT